MIFVEVYNKFGYPRLFDMVRFHSVVPDYGVSNGCHIVLDGPVVVDMAQSYDTVVQMILVAAAAAAKPITTGLVYQDPSNKFRIWRYAS